MVGLPLLAVADDAPTGYDLFRQCSGELGVTNEAFCRGFVAGMFALGGSVPSHCAMRNVQVGHLQMIYKRWAEQHPDKLNLSSTQAVELALSEAFPCPPR
jgi:hypothetical protein